MPFHLIIKLLTAFAGFCFTCPVRRSTRKSWWVDWTSRLLWKWASSFVQSASNAGNKIACLPRKDAGIAVVCGEKKKHWHTHARVHGHMHSEYHRNIGWPNLFGFICSPSYFDIPSNSHVYGSTSNPRPCFVLVIIY